MTVTTAKWTIEEYHRLVATGLLDDRTVELLNGEIIEMPPEGEPHSSSSTVGRDYLIKLLGDRAIVREGHPITIPVSQSEPEPDLAIVAVDEDDYWERHPRPENVYWLIEFSQSSLQKDLEAKAKLYAAAGILEYWVVNLRDMELVVMREPIDGSYRSQVIVTEGMIHPLAFPELAVAVSKLLRKKRR